MKRSEKSERPKWVFWSTRESIDSDIPSLLAIMETIIAVPFYWWIAIHFETYTPLLLSVIVAPLVLLRSDQSIALGVRWFISWTKRWNDGRGYNHLESRDRRVVWIIGVLAVALPSASSYFLARHFLVGAEVVSLLVGAIGFVIIAFAVAIILAGAGARAIIGTGGFEALKARFGVVGLIALGTGLTGAVATVTTLAEVEHEVVWKLSSVIMGGSLSVFTIGYMILSSIRITPRRFLIGVVIGCLCVVATALIGVRHEAITDVMLFALVVLGAFLIGLALGTLLFSVAVRFGATVAFLGPGFRNLPRNFRRLTLCVSPLQEPELLPGLPSNELDFTLAGVLEASRSDLESADIVEKTAAVFALLLVALVWFLPAWLYRATLKSTAWFWWPLAYLGADVKLAKNPDEFRRVTMGSLWAKASIGTAIVTIIGFVWINIVQSGALFKENPLLSAVGYIFVVDWAVPPWQLLTVVLAVLSIALVFLVDDAGGQYRLAIAQRNDELRGRAEWRLRWAERVARGRFVLLLLFMIIAGGQALLYFNSLRCTFDVPTWIERQGNWLYGERMPRGMCRPEAI